MPFSKCLRAKIYSNMNAYFDPQGCQTLLLKESDSLFFLFGLLDYMGVICHSELSKPSLIFIMSLSLLQTFKYQISTISKRNSKSRKENPQKLTQLSSRSHPRHPAVKRTAQKDTIIDTTSDSQVNSNFPYR